VVGLGRIDRSLTASNGWFAEPQVRSVQCEHDQQSEDDREAESADQIRAELACRLGPPELHDVHGEKSSMSAETTAMTNT